MGANGHLRAAVRRAASTSPAVGRAPTPIPKGAGVQAHEQLVANIDAARVRRASYNGREYLVAPGVLIVPGVLPGSQGPLYYPPDEVGKDPGAWHDKPMT